VVSQINFSLFSPLLLLQLQDRLVSEDWDTEVFTSNIHPFQDDCSGHHKDDTLVFGDVDGHPFTNGEYYDYLNPKESNTPYVYDNFEWKHCAALGYDIAQRPLDDDAAQAEAEENGKSSWAGGTPAPAPPSRPDDIGDDAAFAAGAPPAHDDAVAAPEASPAAGSDSMAVGQVPGAYPVPLTSGM
jgi:hypothetical protein